ncbi:hypothetical protein HPB50_024486 [Hyalomma asiaticum]|uniref:Uncharacterized protein n=1 Tax=Hyalomma asiaticum TaxID=266040 RepID=A0ACB7SXS2_HYAAI|nr:hypothetical protein HPB50_024486 [Hyalomma asiaticum]
MSTRRRAAGPAGSSAIEYRHPQGMIRSLAGAASSCNVKNITKLNETELKLGVTEKTSWHKKYKDSAWIFVGGLDYQLTEGDVICVFSQYGEIVNINLIRDKKTGKSKGYCFLCYEDQRSTVLSVDNLNGISLCKRTIRVDHVENYRPPKDSEDLDALMAKLHREGCAPETVARDEHKSEDDSEDEMGAEEGPQKGPPPADSRGDDPEYAKRLKKEKKKLKKERKKKKRLKREKRKLKRMAAKTGSNSSSHNQAGSGGGGQSSESASSGDSGSASDNSPARPQSPPSPHQGAGDGPPPSNGLPRQPITGIQSRLVKLAMADYPLSPVRPRSPSPSDRKRRTPPAGYRSPSFQSPQEEPLSSPLAVTSPSQPAPLSKQEPLEANVTAEQEVAQQAPRSPVTQSGSAPSLSATTTAITRHHHLSSSCVPRNKVCRRDMRLIVTASCFAFLPVCPQASTALRGRKNNYG